MERNKLMPETLGHVRPDETNIFMPDLALGDTRAKAIASGLEKGGTEVESINMRNNRLTGKGAASLVTKLNPLVIKSIDLSNNCLGVVAMEGMLKLCEKTMSLKNFGLEQCNISVSALKILISGIELNVSLDNLNLA